MALALQNTTLDRNMNVEAGLKLIKGLSCNLVEDSNLGIGRHCKFFIPFVHAKVVLPSQCSSLDRK